MNKKGVSPLIATVLIIGFTIALAAIVFTWGGGFVKSTTEKTEQSADLTLKCSTELNFDIKKASKTTTTSTLTVDNKGNIDIKALKIRFYDAAGAVLGGGIPTELTVLTGNLLDAYAVKTFTQTTTPAITIPATAVKLDAIATIVDDAGNEYTCGQAAVEKTIETT